MGNRVVLLLGGNVGDVAKKFSDVKQELQSLMSIVNKSKIITTPAWGNTNQADFLNQALLIKTDLSPDSLLKVILNIELKLGRVRQEKWGPRTIDIDILVYEDIVLETEHLTIPHKYLDQREFSLLGLVGVWSDWEHPTLHKTAIQLLEELK
ncbi:MAG: 2-amino-4-hydroxy-6-hydroxymethyldihydropteridine diphosphokinase [Bacteroidota bacterium]|nr:2-amino-4-hydroxy-6-hydroxymethyldihydropteridine diphosphokinase [Bacteroidota bacterium]